MLSSTLTERGPVRRSPLRRASRTRQLAGAGAAILLFVVTGGPALAASLGATTANLLSGSAAVASCGTLSSAVVTYVLTAKNVTGVVVSSLPAACNGASLWVTLTAGTASAAQAGPLTIASGTATATTLSATPVASTITNAYLAASG